MREISLFAQSVKEEDALSLYFSWELESFAPEERTHQFVFELQITI